MLRRQVEVCYFRIPQNSAALVRLRALLAAQERDRVAAASVPDERDRRIASRGLLRLLLGHRLGADPARLVFLSGAKGKPVLQPIRGRQLQFNLSHSGEYLAIAWSDGGSIGIDIERYRQVRDADGLVRRFFASEEREAFASIPESDRESVFRSLWTYKEAVLKAVGCGIAGGLDGCAVDMSGPKPRLSWISERLGKTDLRNWKLWSLQVPAGYRGALACYEPDVEWYLAQQVIEQRDWLGWLE